MVTNTLWNHVDLKDIIGLWHHRHARGRGLAANVALFINVDYESAKAKAYYLNGDLSQLFLKRSVQ